MLNPYQTPAMAVAAKQLQAANRQLGGALTLQQRLAARKAVGAAMAAYHVAVANARQAAQFNASQAAAAAHSCAANAKSAFVALIQLNQTFARQTKGGATFSTYGTPNAQLAAQAAANAAALAYAASNYAQATQANAAAAAAAAAAVAAINLCAVTL